MLDARRLQVLRAVIDAGSITAASKVLGYTPSAVSQSVAALEREAKIPLFEKSGRGIRPTEAGIVLAEHASAVIKELDRAEGALEALRAGRTGRLRLAAFATAGASLVPAAVARFKEMHPGIELDLAMAETDEALAALRSGHIDLAVVGQPDEAGAGVQDLKYEHLVDDPYRLVLPREHPAASTPFVELADLREESWIATASARCNCLPTVTTACARAGFTPTFAVEADEFATTVGFVAAGLGVAMVPLLALSSIPDGVRVCRLQGEEPKRFVYAVTRAATADGSIVYAMQEALRLSAGAHLTSAA